MMKQSRKFLSFAVFTILFVLMSMAFAVVTAMAAPTQHTHSINIVPQTTTVRHMDELVLDIHISRLPYANELGDSGIGWTEFDFDLYFDPTRFVPIPYAAGRQPVMSDFGTWLDFNNNPVGGATITTFVDPFNSERPSGTLRISLSIMQQHPVMTNITLHVRFRVLETAPAGNDILFSWGRFPGGGVAGFCPVLGPLHGIFGLPIAGPHLEDYGMVNVVVGHVIQPPPQQPTHSINIIPREISVRRNEELALDIHISRLPYADEFGSHGVGWTDFVFDLYFDPTRFVPIPYAMGTQLVASDFTTWHDFSGNPVGGPTIDFFVNPFNSERPNGTIRISLSIMQQQPVMNDITLHVRFRVLETAPAGNDILFSWGRFPGGAGVAGFCPVRGPLNGIWGLPIAGPYLEDCGIVNVVVGHVIQPPPQQPTHSINIIPQETSVRRNEELALDIHISRLPYADEYGNYGIGWTEFFFDVYFDPTRFEPILYTTGTQLVTSDFSTWLCVNGNPVGEPTITTVVNPFVAGRPSGTLRIALSIMQQNPVMSDIVLHVRFRVLETAPAGNDVLFSWNNFPSGGVAGFCPVLGPGSGIFLLPIAGPYPIDFGMVNVIVGHVIQPPPQHPTHSINIIPRETSVERNEELALDIHISRLPYADEFGDHGIGWTEFDFDVYFDPTRFVPIIYTAGPGAQLVTSDFSTWLDVNGNPVGGPTITTIVNPFVAERPSGTLRISLSIMQQNPVMNDIVLHVRFKVLENAPGGNDILFSWNNFPGGGVAGFCPVLGPGRGIFHLPIAGPYPEDFGTVDVVEEAVTPLFSLHAFNNGAINNQSLANGGTIRIWPRLDGVNALVPHGGLTVTAVLPSGESAMQFVSINRIWNNPNYVNMIDVNMHAPWQRIYLTAVSHGQTVELTLINPRYFSLQAFNNGVINNQSLANGGIIRIWTRLMSVPALVPSSMVVTAVDQDGANAMEFVRINEIWNNLGNVNFIDVNFDAPWHRIYFTATVFGQTAELVLVNPVPPVVPEFSLHAFNNGLINNQSLANAGVVRLWTRLDGVNANVLITEITAVDRDGNDAMVHLRRINALGVSPQNGFDVDFNAPWQLIHLAVTAYGQTIEFVLVNPM